MCFEAGAGDLLVGGIDGFGAAGFQICREMGGAADDFEEMHGSEVFEEFGDAIIGIQQFDAAFGGGAVGIEFHAEAGEDAQKGAIHQDTFGKINDKMVETLLGKAIKQGLKVRAEGEIRATCHFNAGKAFTDQDRQIW